MKKVLSVCVCLGLLIVSVTAVSGLLSNKESETNYRPFFEQSEDYDVLFFGTSHMHRAVDPMALWRDFGIVSYNMANEGCRIATIYWQIRLTLEYTTPKLIVVDCAYLNREEKVNKDGAVHKVLDIFPISRIKAEAVSDLYKDQKQWEKFLLPFSTYHNRWNELTEGDFRPDYNKSKGFIYEYTVCPVRLPVLEPKRTAEVKSTSVEYLERIRDLCRERGIELLLTFIPYEYSENSANDGVFVCRFAEKNGIRCLNGNELRTIVNGETDFINGIEDNSHLNWSGAQKITAYTGRYIREHYQSVADHRKDPVYRNWKSDYRKYRSNKWRTIRKAKALEEILISCFDKDLDFLIEVNDQDIFKIQLYEQLFANLGIVARETEGLTLFLRTDGDSTCMTEEEAFDTGVLVRKAEDLHKTYLVLGDTETEINLLKEEGQIRVILLETETHNKVDSVIFDYQTKEISSHKAITVSEAKRE